MLLFAGLLLLVLVAGVAVGVVLVLVRDKMRQGTDADAASLAAQLSQQAARLEEARERDSAQREKIARLEEQAARAAEFQTALGETSAQLDGARTQAADARERLTAAEASIDSQKDLLARFDQEIGELRAKRDSLIAEQEQLQKLLAQATTTLESERTQNAEKLALLNDARAELSNQFKALAADILEEKSRRFTEQNQANLGQILDPLKTRLADFQSKVEEVQKEGIAGRTELRSHIDQLRSLNERLSADANSLVNALKGSSKTQGDWGEFILESILEGCGLRKGEQYRVQESFSYQDETGRRRARPDVILDLPEGKHLVIDAKVSLLDYNDYCNHPDERERAAALARHIGSVRNHLKDLSGRNYQALYDLKTLDFVVMFIPIEPAFMLAIANDSRIWQDAWNKNVLLVSPSTLLFVVRTVSQLWNQERQVRNVQEIVRRGGELYDKLAAFAKDLVNVGKSLDAARQSYDDAYKKLRTGRGNAIRQAELLKKLGVRPTKAMPLPLVEEAMDESADLPESEPLSFPEPAEPLEIDSLAAELGDSETGEQDNPVAAGEMLFVPPSENL
jgi:DNA recombination protein RmuC